MSYGKCPRCKQFMNNWENCGLSIKRRRIKKVIDDWNNRPREDGILDDIKKRDAELFKDLKAWTIKLDGMFLSNTAIKTIKEIIKKYEGENEA